MRAWQLEPACIARRPPRRPADRKLDAIWSCRTLKHFPDEAPARRGRMSWFPIPPATSQSAPAWSSYPGFSPLDGMLVTWPPGSAGEGKVAEPWRGKMLRSLIANTPRLIGYGPTDGRMAEEHAVEPEFLWDRGMHQANGHALMPGSRVGAIGAENPVPPRQVEPKWRLVSARASRNDGRDACRA